MSSCNTDLWTLIWFFPFPISFNYKALFKPNKELSPGNNFSPKIYLEFWPFEPTFKTQFNPLSMFFIRLNFVLIKNWKLKILSEKHFCLPMDGQTDGQSNDFMPRNKMNIKIEIKQRWIKTDGRLKVILCVLFVSGL